MRIALVGAGNVGTAVAYLLAQKGHEVVGVASRSSGSATRAAERIGAAVYSIEDFPSADLVLIGTSDAAIEEVADRVAPRVDEGAYVCHFAGSMGAAPLKAVLERDASACAIHPVQACPSVDAALNRLPGSAWGVTCSDSGADDAMTSFIRDDLDGIPIVVQEEVRPIWHAASVATSNGIAALMAVGETLLREIGVEDPVEVLGPLAAGTVENARAGGGGGPTLTGPIVRGDLETVKRHVDALKDRPGELMDAFKVVGLLILQAAQREGRIDPEYALQVTKAIQGR